MEVVDTSTKQVITSIKLDEPTSVAVTPDGAHAYIGLFSGDVVVVDTATHATIATISVDRVRWRATAGEVSITPDGSRAFVLNGFTHTISVIDTASHTVTGTIDVTPPQDWSSMSSMFMRADGGQLYLPTDNGVNTVGLSPGIGVVNTDDYSVSFWPREFEDIALAPDSTTVYRLGVFSNIKVDVLDTAGLPKTFPLQISQEVQPQVMAVAPDGRHLFILGIESLVVVDATTANVVDTIPIFRFDLTLPGVHVSPDGRQIYVVGRENADVAVIDATKYN